MFKTDEDVQNIVDELNVNENTSIDSDEYKKYKKAYEYAMSMLQKECKQATQGLYHNLNTLESRQGSQVPFTSINLGRDTSEEGRLVSKSILEASLDGIGKFHQTSIFPISIFQYKKGVNVNPEDPNYDLKLLALKSLSKRIYPNWANCDWSQAHEDPLDPDTFFSTMGALDENERLFIKIDDDYIYNVSIKDFFEYCKTGNLSNPINCNQYFKPYKIQDNFGIYSITYLPEDITYVGSSSNINTSFDLYKHLIKETGNIFLCNFTFNDTDLSHYEFKSLNKTEDYTEKTVADYPELFKLIHPQTITNDNDLSDEKQHFISNRDKQQILIDLKDKNIKVLDRNNLWVKVLHIFKNDKENTPPMLSISYKIDNKVYNLSCTSDHPLWNGSNFIKAEELNVGDIIYRVDDEKCEIVSIRWYKSHKDSYDIGTITGSFIGSNIVMHNCRTMIGYDKHGLGYKRVGRGNNVPNTIILPKLGIEYGICLNKREKPDLDGFWKAFEETLKLTEKTLLERYHIMIKQSPKSAPFMYQNGTMTDAQKCVDTVEDTLKHNTLAIGYIGIAEMCTALFGVNHVHSAEAYDLAYKVVQRINKYASEASERNNLNFSCYATPAEGLCRTALRFLRDEYGVIKGVTDREYITNSHHVPVWEKVGIYEKLMLESPFCKFPTGGCITYVELESTFMNNIKAIEDIIDFAFQKLDIPYLAFNFPIDNCLNCGYSGEFNDKCPECGSTNIQQLRRVTGYLTTDYRNFNAGKFAETNERVKHSLYSNYTKVENVDTETIKNVVKHVKNQYLKLD